MNHYKNGFILSKQASIRLRKKLKWYTKIRDFILYITHSFMFIYKPSDSLCKQTQSSFSLGIRSNQTELGHDLIANVFSMDPADAYKVFH